MKAGELECERTWTGLKLPRPVLALHEFKIKSPRTARKRRPCSGEDGRVSYLQLVQYYVDLFVATVDWWFVYIPFDHNGVWFLKGLNVLPPKQIRILANAFNIKVKYSPEFLNELVCYMCLGPLTTANINSRIEWTGMGTLFYVSTHSETMRMFSVFSWNHLPVLVFVWEVNYFIRVCLRERHVRGLFPTSLLLCT